MGAALKVISVLAEDVELRWSAKERDLYAVWQGVVGHERLIKGLRFLLQHRLQEQGVLGGTNG